MITRKLDEEEEEELAHDRMLWFLYQSCSSGIFEATQSRATAVDILRVCGKLPPTVRPDSDYPVADCRYFNAKERTIPECESDGHYACEWCKNYTGVEDSA